VVHVDLNCIFEEAQGISGVECVPFRLTHNLVDALGVTGSAGVYTKACEVTLQVLRDNRESLLSCLATFVHDPLIERDEYSGTSQEHTQEFLHVIDRKIQGLTASSPTQPLSVAAHVQELIAEANSAASMLDFKSNERILALERVMLEELKARIPMNLPPPELQQVSTTISRAAGLSWLASSRIARKSGSFQCAFAALLQAESFGLPDLKQSVHCTRQAPPQARRGQAGNRAIGAPPQQSG
jgi:hypothetical protein